MTDCVIVTIVVTTVEKIIIVLICETEASYIDAILVANSHVPQRRYFSFQYLCN